MTKQLKKGFTLVELIVVIAIIAILSTVSVVGYSAFMNNANQSKVDQEMAQFKNVLVLEAVETVSVDDEGRTLVISIEGTTVVFTFGASTYDEDEINDLLGALKDKLEQSSLKGVLTLKEENSKDYLVYTLDRFTSSFEVVIKP